MLSQINNAKIAELGKLFANNVVVVNSVNDFNVQDATTITLEGGVTYVPAASFTTSKRFIVRSESPATFVNPLGTAIVGTNSLIVWKSTTTGAMFSGVDVNLFFISSFGFECEDASEIFNISDSLSLNSSNFQMLNSFGFATTPTNIIAQKFGTFTDLSIILINNCAVAEGLGIEDGITLAGSGQDAVVIDDFGLLGLTSTGIALDLSTGVIEFECRVDNLTTAGDAGSIGISGLTGSANMGPGLIGSFRDNTFLGAMTPLSGVSESDLRLEFRTSDPIPDSSKTADTFLTASQAVTITTAGVFVAIAGVNWSSDVEERFSTTTAGLATYLSPISTKAQVTITATMEKVGGGTDEIELVVAINGVVSTKSISTTKNKDPTALTSVGLYTLNTNDTIQAFVANIDSTANIVVSRSSVNIINGF